MAASVGVVPFLKAPLRRLLVLWDAPGEDPDPLDRAVAALRRRDLPEDAALEAPIRRCSAASL